MRRRRVNRAPESQPGGEPAPCPRRACARLDKPPLRPPPKSARPFGQLSLQAEANFYFETGIFQTVSRSVRDDSYFLGCWEGGSHGLSSEGALLPDRPLVKEIVENRSEAVCHASMWRLARYANQVAARLVPAFRFDEL